MLDNLLIWVLNFILASCNYNCQIADFPANSNHDSIEYSLQECGALKPGETMKTFFETPRVQEAFQEASVIWVLSREDKDRFEKMMTQQ